MNGLIPSVPAPGSQDVPKPWYRLAWIGDPFVLGLLVLVTVLFIPLVTPVFSPEATEFYNRRLIDLPLLAMAGLGAMLAARAHSGDGRRFWRIAAWAVLAYLMARLLFLVPVGLSRPAVSVLQELAYLTWYLLIGVALEGRPGDPVRGPVEAFQHRVWLVTAAIFFLGIAVFFVVFSFAVSPSTYQTGGPSLLMYSVLDLYLVARISVLRMRTGRRYWYRVYGWLMIASLLWAGLDLWEALQYLIEIPDLGNTLASSIWVWPIVVLAVAASARDPVSDRRPIPDRHGRTLVSGNAIPFLLLAVPGIHFGMYWAGWLDEAGRPFREVWVMLALTAFTMVGIWYQRGLERILARLGAEAARAEERLARSQRLEVVSRLSAGVAHDFNNLLTIIVNGAELLRSPGRNLDPTVQTEAEEILRASHRGAEMIQRLLSFGAGRNLDLVPLNLGSLVERLIPTLRRLIPASIEIRYHAPAEPVLVRGDQTAIEEILINLATNGRDAMPEGGALTLDVGRMDAGALDTPASVALTVRDSGQGMSAETRSHLFEPYFTTRGGSGGTGLGLAMVYGLTHQMKGQIEVQSEIGRGTTMRIILPATDSLPVRPAPCYPVMRAEEMTVLLVEDDDAVRRITERVLARAGYRVLTAADGQAGLETLRAHRAEIGLVLTDMTMPVLGGIELFRAVRGTSSVPFLFMSGYAEAKPTVEQGIELALLPKPFTPEELLGAIARVLDPPPPH